MRTARGFTLVARSARAFTLIELLVVISIIAIMAATGLVVYQSAQKSANDGKRIGDMQEMQKALEQYYTINQAYPSNNNVDIDTLSSLSSYFANNTPPKDPKTSFATYKYFYCASPISYIACAKLENPGNKANTNALPSDGCATINSSGTTYYCIKSVSN